MTKRELIQILAPFSDDIRIFREGHDHQLFEVRPWYSVLPESEPELDLDKGEGVVIL